MELTSGGCHQLFGLLTNLPLDTNISAPNQALSHCAMLFAQPSGQLQSFNNTAPLPALDVVAATLAEILDFDTETMLAGAFRVNLELVKVLGDGNLTGPLNAIDDDECTINAMTDEDCLAFGAIDVPDEMVVGHETICKDDELPANETATEGGDIKVDATAKDSALGTVTAETCDVVEDACRTVNDDDDQMDSGFDGC